MEPRPASGFLCLGPGVFITTAFILSLVATSRCELLQFDHDKHMYRGILDLDYKPMSIGLWCYRGMNGDNYDLRKITFDSYYETARGFGTAATAVGFIGWVFYVVAVCCPFPPTFFRIVGLLMIVNCVFQGLVFLIEQSDVCERGCSLDIHGRCAIAAIVFYFVGGITSLASGKRASPAEPQQEKEVVHAVDEENVGGKEEDLKEQPKPIEKQESELEQEA